MDPSLCRITESLLFSQYETLRALNQKFYALQRLAELMSNAANPLVTFPGLPVLIPVSNLTLAMYENLRASCPGLNLPSGIDGLIELQNELRAAYDRVIGMLFNHPWNRMGWLQRQMDRVTCQSLIDPQLLQNWLNCANAACQTMAGVPDALRDQQAALNEFNDNFVNNPTGILNESMQLKNQQVNELIDYVNGLKV